MPSKVHASKKSIVTMPYTPSLIQTILSVPELRRFLRPRPLADYHCRWGISPRPEDSYSVVLCGWYIPAAAKMQQEIAKLIQTEIIIRVSINNT